MTFVFQFEESMSGFNAAMYADSFVLFEKKIGAHFDDLVVSKNRVYTNFVSADGQKACDSFSRLNFIESAAPRQAFLAETASQRREFDELYADFSRETAASLSNDKLLSFFRRYCKIWTAIIANYGFSQAEITQSIMYVLKERLAAKGVQNVDGALALLLAPNRADAIKRDELDLIRLALDGFDRRKLEAHTLAYRLMFYNSYTRDANVAYVEKRVKALQAVGRAELVARLASAEKEIAAAALKQENLLAELADPQIQELSAFLRDIGHDRLELKNYWAGAEYLFLSMFEEIARRMQVPLPELMTYYFPSDVEAFLLQGKALLPEQAREKRKFYVFQIKAGKVSAAEGAEAKAIAMQLAPQYFSVHEISEFKGTTASKGIARGKARVVLNGSIEELEKELAEFVEGDVLVSRMTQPNMVVLARKASAIVTDEGGITSHAAILAREFGIPCVVGTHVATKALKNGDLVEVDATGREGIVRIESE